MSCVLWHPISNFIKYKIVNNMKEYKFQINGSEYNVKINEVEGQEIKLEVNGNPYNVVVDKEVKQKPHTTVVNTRPAARVATGDMQRSSTPKQDAGNKIQSPLPGTILDVLVKVGDTVKEGQAVAILEAMKMENSITADVDGTVASIDVKPGDAVLEGATLVVIK